MGRYSDMAVQITRGCPESCTFCNIPDLYGKGTRLKGDKAVVEEFELLYNLGWRGPVMIVDDNMVGNQKAIKPRLKAIGDWQRERGYPFPLFGQVSLRVHDDSELMDEMRYAGFGEVFIGLESPSPESLKFMGAQKNDPRGIQRDEKSMLEKVRDIQRNYFRVMAGFIIGTDNDPDNIVDLMKDFISDSGVGIAMVGPLGVLPDTPDWTRFERQGRLVKSVRYGGESGIFSRNLSFVPQDRGGNEIDPRVILDRHRDIISHINSPKEYFSRAKRYLLERERKPLTESQSDYSQLPGLFRSIWKQGVVGDYKGEYWKFLGAVMKHDRTDLADAIHYAAQGDHFIKTTRAGLKVDDYATLAEAQREEYIEWARNLYSRGGQGVQERVALIKSRGQELVKKAKKELGNLHEGLRKDAVNAYSELRNGVVGLISKYAGHPTES